MCTDHHAAASAVALILNQRLTRRVCDACAGAGCETCLHTGYYGRVPVVEWFRVYDATRAVLRTQGATAIQPAQSLAAAAQELVTARVTNQKEWERMFAR